MTTATYSVRVGDEVYVYVRGHLVMKRWLTSGLSVTLHVAPEGVRWNRGDAVTKSECDYFAYES